MTACATTHDLHCFAAYAVHELRTPVALQLALAEAALSDPLADENMWRATCEDIVASCEQQQRLIEALLDLTHGDRGLTHRAPVDIAAITARALQVHERSPIGCIRALEPAVTMGDPTLLERLAANLVSNAVRHNIPHGRFKVATRTDAGCALLAVANTGPLIQDRDIARLFRPFERLGSRPRGWTDGVGLGLTIVKAIADAHRATVAAHAQGGGGLAIEVRFPLARGS